MGDKHLRLNPQTSEWEPVSPGWSPGKALLLTAGCSLLALLVGVGIGTSSKKEQTVATSATPTTTIVATTTPATAAATAPTTTPTTAAPTTTPTTKATTTTKPQPKQVASFGGTSDKETESFTVGPQWKLAWDVQAQTTPAIEVWDSAGNRPVERYDTGAPGKGETIVRHACTCYLKVSVFGDTTWKITVTDLPT